MTHFWFTSEIRQPPKSEQKSLKLKIQNFIGTCAALHDAHHIKHELLENPDFKLIHVIPNGQPQPEMKIVIPARDRAVYDAVNQQGYYAVSHLWGERENWRLWTNHGIVGPDGERIEARILPTKRAAILSLLSSRPGFWWIDVFCWQFETPPPIMRHVYRFCKVCFALVDLPPAKFFRIQRVAEQLGRKNHVKPDRRIINEIANCYKKRIYGKTCTAERTWHESLDDLLGGWYKGDPEDIKALAEFFGCRWFTRVWTLQEYALPSQLIFISESDPRLQKLDRNLTTFIVRMLCTVANKVFLPYMLSPTRAERLDFYNSMAIIEHRCAMNTPGASRCYVDLTRLDAMMIHGFYASVGYFPGVMKTSSQRMSRKSDPLVLILKKLARMPRICMYPKDFVYGVTGLLDLEIDIADEDGNVWTNFKNAVLERVPGIDFDPNFVLSNATDLQTVYNMFISADTTKYSYALDKFSTIWPQSHSDRSRVIFSIEWY
ncbi:hypothetical protein BX666DRAFT_1992571 [Dichotomocladium elegans]|nr:hypothetical protein BX666DRAFT_1992571 [Dichotomocladium elegans]